MIVVAEISPFKSTCQIILSQGLQMICYQKGSNSFNIYRNDPIIFFHQTSGQSKLQWVLNSPI